jgi:predicted nucleic acid-binding protein
MLVVADSSPLNVLICIGHAEILHQLFHNIIIPSEVARELSRPRTPVIVRNFIASSPHWLTVCEPKTVEPIAQLHAGELAAISLANELAADFLLIDDKAGRRAALQRNLRIIGTIGVLEQAAVRELLDFPSAMQQLPSDFRARLHPSLVKDALDRDAIRKKSR